MERIACTGRVTSQLNHQKSISEGCRKESWQTCEEALGEKVRGQQPADRPDRRLEDGDVDVDIKAHLGGRRMRDVSG